MTDRSKFEQMLESLLSEDQDKARELFHQLVVEKSREIYENILAEDFDEEEEEEVEESNDNDADDEEVEENFNFEAEDEVGGDATDDFIDDVEFGGDEEDDMGDDFGGDDDMGGEEEVEDRVQDLEDALEDLKAEFERLMSAEEGEEEHGDMGFGGEEESEDEFGGEEDDEQKDEDFVREYVEKITPKMGDNGVNTKSTVAGKNDMGGSSANIAKGGEAKGEGTKGGLLNPSEKEDNAGNVNVPGAKGAQKLSKVSTPKGGDNGVNAKSIVGK